MRNETLTYRLSLLCIGSFAIWLIFALILPEANRTIVFYILGSIPVTGWFIIKPQRILRFMAAISGLTGLKD